ncbi:MAG TPA: D-Ala-D-Ala carboxypeptidase family metallohydrolase [Gemmatimonadaceae bacterium]|nr:D-Ala-D-Ala carboxypeptidase family metallohydrolase [Gemmatimonadaceae bacterium]
MGNPFENFPQYPPPPRPVRRGGAFRSRASPVLAFVILALGTFLALRKADAAFGPPAAPEPLPPPPVARLASSALGRSRGVHMRFALPGERVQFPLELGAAPSSVTFEWIPLGELASVDTARSVAGTLDAPRRPGFYRLAVRNRGGATIIDSLTLAVLVPFGEKQGGELNGYEIGYYKGERTGDAMAGPRGFLEIEQPLAELSLSAHMRVSDFITHDQQTRWPRYAAVDGRLLDKLELVFDEIASWHGGEGRAPVEVDVHSGFRTPLYNRRVPRSAADSRHQYGDAADVAIDANRDGVVNAKDVRLIELAVEIVERKHPDLVGGLGVYTQGGASYAHIDARGERKRWRS